MRAVLVLLCGLGLAGCVASKSVECGAVICPQSYVCTGASICVSQQALDACKDKGNGDPCSADRASGECVDGSCITIVCGNGRLDPGEVCDDGNLEYGDNCNPTCQSELFCGNGYIDPGELCDCGDGQTGHANATCTVANSNDSNATCRPDCTPHSCGDGVRENNEQCDKTDLGTSTCASYGFYAGSIGCSDVCQYLTTGCSQYCGDGTVNGPLGIEACDGSPPEGESCVTYGYDAGRLGCSPSLCRPTFGGCHKIGWVEYGADSRRFFTVWGSGPSDVYGGGTGGGVVHWNGTSWTAVAISGLASDVVGIWGSASNDVWLVADVDVYHYDGTVWTHSMTLPFAGASISGSGSRIFVVGLDGAIETYDGSSWSAMSPPTAFALNSVHVISSTLAYAGGGDDVTGVLFKWTGGSSWTPVTIPNMVGIVDVWGRSASDLYIGDAYTLDHWDGSNWSTIHLGLRNGPSSISGTATDVWVTFDTTEMVVGQFDGSAWTLHVPEVSAPLSAVWPAGDGTAFLAGLRMSRYAGAGWTKPAGFSQQRVQINAAGGTPSGQSFVVGEAGFALRRDPSSNANWYRLPGDVTRNLNGASADVVVGDVGTLAVFTGTRLVAKPSGTIENLNGVFAVSSTDAWAVGDAGVVVHFDGSSGDTSKSSGTTENLHAAWGFSTSEVYAVGDASTIVRWNGSSWVAFPTALPVTADLYGVWGTAGNNLYVVGSNGTARRWNGSAWLDLAPPTTATILSVYGRPTVPNSVYMADGGSGLLLWDAGTTTWQGRVGNTPNARAVGGKGADLYGMSTNFTLYRRDPFGAFKSELRDLDQAFISHLYATSPADVYASAGTDLFHFDGYLWARVETGGGADMCAIAGTSATDVWVAFSGFNAAHTQATSVPWVLLSTGLTGHQDMSIGTPNRPFVIAPNGNARWFDGAAWQSADAPGPLTAIWSASQTDVFGVGATGNVLRWNGSTWGTVSGSTIPSTTALWAVFGLSSTDVYVAGDGEIDRWHNNTWDRWTSIGSIRELYGVADDLFAGGTNGLLFHFDGQAWTPIRSPGSLTINAIAGASKMTWIGDDASLRGLRRDIPW